MRYVTSCLAAAAAELAVARRHGLSWHELGLTRATMRPGLTRAAGAGLAVGAVYAAGLALPSTRAFFVDERTSHRLRRAAFQALVPVLFGTVLLEEVAFRSVLWGLLNRRHGPRAATAASSILFGVWHVLPSRELAQSNPAAAAALGVGSARRTPFVASAVAVSAGGGVLLCELRRRTGSLLAPAGLHWALNGLGHLAATVARPNPR